MRQRNHCSSLKGIPKMKLQGSGPSAPKSLQSQNRPRPENRLSISRLDVVHGQLMNIENKTVLVTGSTDGVGRLVARRLADQGARVLIHGRDRTRAEQLLKEIRDANRGSAAFLPADFSSLAEVRRLANTVRQEAKRLA